MTARGGCSCLGKPARNNPRFPTPQGTSPVWARGGPHTINRPTQAKDFCTSTSGGLLCEFN